MVVTGEEDAPLLTLDPVLLGVHGVTVRPSLSSRLRWLELTGPPDHQWGSGLLRPGGPRVSLWFLSKQQQHLPGQCETGDTSQLIFSQRLSTYGLCFSVWIRQPWLGSGSPHFFTDWSPHCPEIIRQRPWLVMRGDYAGKLNLTSIGADIKPERQTVENNTSISQQNSKYFKKLPVIFCTGGGIQRRDSNWNILRCICWMNVNSITIILQTTLSVLL